MNKERLLEKLRCIKSSNQNEVSSNYTSVISHYNGIRRKTDGEIAREQIDIIIDCLEEILKEL